MLLQGYYVRTDDYFPTTKRERLGVFQVPMIHSTFLIDLTKKNSQLLQFWPLRKDYQLDVDDIIVFSKHAEAAGNFYSSDSVGRSCKQAKYFSSIHL